MRTGARYVVIASLSAALLFLGVTAAPRIHHHFTHRTVWVRGTLCPGTAADAIGWFEYERYPDELCHGPVAYETWWVDGGFRASLEESYAMAMWNSDGTLYINMGIESCVDQTGPSAPWLEAGITADEWWIRVDPDGSGAK